MLFGNFWIYSKNGKWVFKASSKFVLNKKESKLSCLLLHYVNKICLIFKKSWNRKTDWIIIQAKNHLC